MDLEPFHERLALGDGQAGEGEAHLDIGEPQRCDGALFLRPELDGHGARFEIDLHAIVLARERPGGDCRW